MSRYRIHNVNHFVHFSFAIYQLRFFSDTQVVSSINFASRKVIYVKRNNIYMEPSCLQTDPLLTTTAIIFNLFNNFQPMLVNRSFKSIDGRNENACPVPMVIIVLFGYLKCQLVSIVQQLQKTIKVWIKKQTPNLSCKPSQLSQREIHIKKFSLLPARSAHKNIIW